MVMVHRCSEQVMILVIVQRIIKVLKTKAYGMRVAEIEFVLRVRSLENVSVIIKSDILGVTVL